MVRLWSQRTRPAPGGLESGSAAKAQGIPSLWGQRTVLSIGPHGPAEEWGPAGGFLAAHWG